jgi:pimeloyl-ACP methyl ester carboxylesterase
MKNTGVPVVVFPLSFHLNRAPEVWSDPHIIKGLIPAKAHNSTTIINFALSQRLHTAPERFFLSGYRSLLDLHRWLKMVQDGKHPYFIKGTRTDIFAYSIGAFITQILAIAKPEMLYKSKLFFFCGGALLAGMNLVSKFILDEPATRQIMNFYLREKIKKPIPELHHQILNETSFGRAFQSMLQPENGAEIRNSIFNQIKPNIRVSGLLRDQIVPARSIIDNLSAAIPSSDLDVLDFNFPYTHENPFDVKQTRFKQEIEQEFDQFFQKAAAHFSV